MTTVTIEEAQARLPDLIDGLGAGEGLLITRNEQPVARLTAEEKPKRKRRKAGSTACSNAARYAPWPAPGGRGMLRFVPRAAPRPVTARWPASTG